MFWEMDVWVWCVIPSLCHNHCISTLIQLSLNQYFRKSQYTTRKLAYCDDLYCQFTMVSTAAIYMLQRLHLHPRNVRCEAVLQWFSKLPHQSSISFTTIRELTQHEYCDRYRRLRNFILIIVFIVYCDNKLWRCEPPQIANNFFKKILPLIF